MLEKAVTGLRLPLDSTASSRGLLAHLESAALATNERHLRDRRNDESTSSFRREPAEVLLAPSYSFPDLLPPQYHSDHAGQQPQISGAREEGNGSEAHHIKAQASHQDDLPKASRQQSNRAPKATVGSFDGDLWSYGGNELLQSTRPAKPECTHARELASSPIDTTSGVITIEKSCEEAASILAQLREGSELDDIRRDLRCLGRDACVIRNTGLLQIMDKFP